MKKGIVIGGLILSVCLSFLAGRTVSQQEERERREYQCHAQMVFAIDKVEQLKAQYDQDDMEALISNIYAAYEYADDALLSSALHDLWNALIFDGENIAGQEDELVKVLQEGHAPSIQEFAIIMRMKP